MLSLILSSRQTTRKSSVPAARGPVEELGFVRDGEPALRRVSTAPRAADGAANGVLGAAANGHGPPAAASGRRTTRRQLQIQMMEPPEPPSSSSEVRERVRVN